MNVCSSGQSQFLMYSKTLSEEKNAFIFRRFQSQWFYSSAAVCKNPEEENKNLAQWNGENTTPDITFILWVKRTFPTRITLFSFSVEVLPNQVISGKSCFLGLPLTLEGALLIFP